MTFEESYTLYSRDVWRFAYFTCRDASLADDITSEAFVRLWSRPRDLRGQTIKNYLFAIARNLYLDSRRQKVEMLELDDRIAEESVPMEEKLDHANRLRQVMGQIQNLESGEQAALLLRTIDGLSYDEIGSQLGIRPEAAKMRVHRARKKIMEAM